MTDDMILTPYTSNIGINVNETNLVIQINVMEMRDAEIVKLNLKTNPVLFGENVDIECIINSGNTANVMAWKKSPHGETIALNTNSVDVDKYDTRIVHNNSQMVYNLRIKNFDTSDVNLLYTCVYGFNSLGKKISLNEKDFIAKPSKKDVKFNFGLTDSQLTGNIQIRNGYPAPTCTGNFQGQNISEIVISNSNDSILFESKIEIKHRTTICKGTIMVTCTYGKRNILITDEKNICPSTTENLSDLNLLEYVIVIASGVLLLTLVSYITIKKCPEKKKVISLSKKKVPFDNWKKPKLNIVSGLTLAPVDKIMNEILAEVEHVESEGEIDNVISVDNSQCEEFNQLNVNNLNEHVRCEVDNEKLSGWTAVDKIMNDILLQANEGELINEENGVHNEEGDVDNEEGDVDNKDGDVDIAEGDADNNTSVEELLHTNFVNQNVQHEVTAVATQTESPLSELSEFEQLVCTLKSELSENYILYKDSNRINILEPYHVKDTTDIQIKLSVVIDANFLPRIFVHNKEIGKDNNIWTGLPTVYSSIDAVQNC
ncbi:unnamed protein product [Mytilus coruscus]|uniref:Ig-like domain-containing protein n=1 Tax=Mytilus coruscus TaxID=42192 RepID=A0A6J7ZUZ8_MYTCO|nr:unnamed protein product [Mytilus coruscus]